MRSSRAPPSPSAATERIAAALADAALQILAAASGAPPSRAEIAKRRFLAVSIEAGTIPIAPTRRRVAAPA